MLKWVGWALFWVIVILLVYHHPDQVGMAIHNFFAALNKAVS